MGVNEVLNRRRKYLKNMERELQNRVKGKPELKIRISNGRYFLRSKPGDRNGVYLSDKSFTKEVAQTDYEREVLKSIHKELDFLDELQDLWPKTTAERVYTQMHPLRQELVEPIYLPKDEFVARWCAVTWEPRPPRDDEPVYETEGGYFVHSKSELVMANKFVAQNVPHRYEYPMYLEGYGPARPDFIVLNTRTRKEYIWEHCGKMDDMDYVARNMKKFAAYRQNGYFLGEDILVTTESAIQEFDPDEVDQLIQHYLL